MVCDLLLPFSHGFPEYECEWAEQREWEGVTGVENKGASKLCRVKEIPLSADTTSAPLSDNKTT